MTDLKTEFKTAVMELLTELVAKPAEGSSSGFGSWASIATAQRVFIQARDGMLWYTRAKDASGKDVNTPIASEQFTGRVITVNTYIGTSESSNPKLLVTMADDDGRLTEFSVGLSNLATGQYTNIAKNFLLAVEACAQGSRLTFYPIEGSKTGRKVVFLKVAIDGVMFYGEKSDRDWPALVAETLERFGGSHSVVGAGGDDEAVLEPRQTASTPKPAAGKPTPAPAPASAISRKMSDAAWDNLKKYGNSTAEGLEFNHQVLVNWCQENYGQPNPRKIPAADQKMALFNAEKMLHDEYYPPAAVEPEERPEIDEDELGVFEEPSYSDDF